MAPGLKLSGIRDLHEARFCAAMGVSFIELPMSGQFSLPPELVSEIKGWINGPQLVGWFENEAHEAIAHSASIAHLDLVSIPQNQGIAADSFAGFQLLLRPKPADTGFSEKFFKVFPDALFEFNPDDGSLRQQFSTPALQGRFIYSVSTFRELFENIGKDPFHPLFWSVNAPRFPNGEMDFSSAEKFVEKFHSLIPAS